MVTEDFKLTIFDELCEVFEIDSVNHRVLIYLGTEAKSIGSRSLQIKRIPFENRLNLIVAKDS